MLFIPRYKLYPYLSSKGNLISSLLYIGIAFSPFSHMSEKKCMNNLNTFLCRTIIIYVWLVTTYRARYLVQKNIFRLLLFLPLLLLNFYPFLLRLSTSDSVLLFSHHKVHEGNIHFVLVLY